jgi:outer membrane receptor protein involved in Fe transport
VHFVPDVYGDLVFNDVASNVSRESLLNGIQFDGSYRLNDVHSLRAGFAVSGEETQVNNTSTVLPVVGGTPLPLPFNLTDYNSKLGWNLGGYIQDEWKLTNNLTLNTGLRFDQLYQFVAANQFSPRVARLQAVRGHKHTCRAARFSRRRYKRNANQPRPVQQHHTAA